MDITFAGVMVLLKKQYKSGKYCPLLHCRPMQRSILVLETHVLAKPVPLLLFRFIGSLRFGGGQTIFTGLYVI